VPLSDDNGRERSVSGALKTGFRGKCPNCGQGKLFSQFLKVSDECPNCGTELHHHRADDFPPYLVIFIVGHIVVTLVLMVEARWEMSTTAHLAIWIPLTLAMCLALLQPVKGAVVGLQWAHRMHGFSGTSETIEDAV